MHREDLIGIIKISNVEFARREQVVLFVRKLALPPKALQTTGSSNKGFKSRFT